MKLEISLLEIGKFFALGLLFLFTAIAPAVASAQTVREPRREQILNGMRVLVFSEPKADKMTVKLRVHAGAAFDPAQKSGTMRLLADLLFPDEGTREFFVEDLGGSLNVESNYDYIEITASARGEEFERIMDTLRTAVTAPPITPENFKKVRDARLKQAQEESKNPANIADLAARKRLYGDFPYGRAMNGTPESIAKIEYADVLLARDRFLTADNATLAIIGNVRDSYALRAARQLFGSWRKADKPVPATFRQPEAPDTKVLIIDAPNADKAEIRFISRGLTGNDGDLIALSLRTRILEKRLQNELGNSVKVEHFAHVLPGETIISVSSPTGDAAKTLNLLRSVLAKAATEKVDSKQFAEIQGQVLNNMQTELVKSENAVNYWLNVDTFKMPPISERLNSVKNAKPADGERIAAKLFKDAPSAIVIVGDADEIQAQVDALGQKK